MTKLPEDSRRDGPRPRTSPRASDGPSTWVAIVVLALAIGAVYGRALDAPFIFDDDGAILSNRSIVALWPLVGTAEHPGPLRPPVPLPTAGRPLVNFTFALNYSFGAVEPTGYHAVNVLIHFFSAALLFAIVSRTLRLAYFAGRFEDSAGWLALASALIWSLHPLQTETVIYATQRTELMMALFYLATLYCSLRYWFTFPLPCREGQGEGLSQRSEQIRARNTWLVLAVLACLCGMASKEVMVSAPLMVLLFDRTFLAGSFGHALRRSWPLYIGLASTWILLLALNIHAPRGDTAGFQVAPSLTSWWLTQSQVLMMYLKLVIWPWPLLIHYELPYLENIGEAWMYVVPIMLLAIVTLALLWRNRPAGFLGTCVFAILAPTSIIPIITEMAAERRMYLPLAAFVLLFVVGTFRLTQFWMRRTADASRSRADLRVTRVVPLSIAFLLALVSGIASAKRLCAYDDDVGLWQDVVARQPANPLAHYNLGQLLIKAGRLPEGITELQAAAKVTPDRPAVFNALGLALTNAGRLPEAIDALHNALTLEPDYVVALDNMGFALTQAGRSSEAVDYLRRAVKLQPDFSNAHNNLGIALGNLGNYTEAIEEFRLALAYNKSDAKAHSNLGLAFFQLGEKSKAIEQFENGLRINPNDANAQYNLAVIFSGEDGRMGDALAHYEQAVRLRPDFADAHNGLGEVLRKSSRYNDAIEHFKIALRIKPAFIEAYANLAKTLAQIDQSKEAIATAEKGIEVATSIGQAVAAQQLQEWLSQFRNERQRREELPRAGPPGIVQ